jgi:photosystem II stability/assembly factor-like uncharacterized protein
LIDERRVFERFHEALDTEPRLGAYERLQTALAARPVRPRRWPQSVLQRPQDRIAIGALVVAVFLAAAVATVFVAARLYAPITVKPPPTVQPSPPASGNAPSVGTVAFTTPQDGLVITQGSLLVTHDGGQHWQMSLAFGPSFPFVKYVDPRQIVLLTGEPRMSDLVKGTLVLHATTDGGAHWVSNPIAAARVTGMGDWTFLSEWTYFINAREGWQEDNFYLDVCDVASPAEHNGLDATNVEPSPCTTTHPAIKAIIIYRTTDSGTHWTEVARVDANDRTSHGLQFEPGISNGFDTGLTFIDSEHGYTTVRGSDGTSRLYVSKDGGSNWTRAELPAPTGGWGGTSGPDLTTLTFFGARGVVVVRMANGTRYTYTTSDSGFTWANAHAIPGEDSYGNLAFTDADHWWLIDGNALYESDNAGATWRTIKTKLPAVGDRFTSISAIGRILWATVAPASACDPSNLADCNFLVLSVDGGVTWSVVKVAIG